MNSVQRITNLDFIRGFALLGILVINVIAFGLPLTATTNQSTYGIDNTLDWIVVVISSVFFEQKMMGLFSMLFGVGIMIFLENAKKKTSKPKTLAMWRNFLLFCFGLLHFSIWVGDVLAPYAICAFLLILFPDVKKPILILSAIVFLIIAIYPFLNQGELRLWSLIISIIFLILGLLNSKLLLPLNKIWFKFGILLGKIVSPLVMGLIFFFVVTPIGILMRILKKDLLNLKFNKKTTYWIEKNGPKSKMKNQF